MMKVLLSCIALGVVLAQTTQPITPGVGTTGNGTSEVTNVTTTAPAGSGQGNLSQPSNASLPLSPSTDNQTKLPESTTTSTNTSTQPIGQGQGNQSQHKFPILEGNLSNVNDWTSDFFNAFADKDFASFLQAVDDDTEFTVYGLNLPFAGEYKGMEVWDLILACEAAMEVQSRPTIEILSSDDIKGISLVSVKKDARIARTGKQVIVPMMFLVRWSLSTGKIRSLEAWVQQSDQFLEAYQTKSETSFWKLMNLISSQKKLDFDANGPVGKLFADNIEIQLFDSSNFLSKPKFSGKQGLVTMFQEIAQKFGIGDDSDDKSGNMSSQPGLSSTSDMSTPVPSGPHRRQINEPVNNTSDEGKSAGNVTDTTVTTSPAPTVPKPSPVPIEPMKPEMGEKGDNFDLFDKTQKLWQYKLLNYIYHNRQYEVVGADDNSVLIRWTVPEGKMLSDDIEGMSRFTFNPEGLLSKIECQLLTQLRPWQLQRMPRIVLPQSQQQGT